MGGYGSGRTATRIDVDACHLLEIGRLCDGQRRERRPRGTITWSDGDSGEILAQASYIIGEILWRDGVPRLVLDLRYRKAPTAPERREPILLREERGGRCVAECPGCRRAVRKLYAPPEANYFACRDCYRLVYRRRPRTEVQAQRRAVTALQAVAIADVREVVGPLLEGPQAAARRGPAERRRAYEALLATIQAELPLMPQELRVYCLRLRREGLSLRQIAALVEISKSSVQRYLAAGLGGLDMKALFAERQERLRDFPAAPSSGDDPEALRAELKAVRLELRQLGL